MGLETGEFDPSSVHNSEPQVRDNQVAKRAMASGDFHRGANMVHLVKALPGGTCSDY